MADAVDHLEFYELVSQKAQGPSLPPIRRFAACQLDQARFDFAIYLRITSTSSSL